MPRRLVLLVALATTLLPAVAARTARAQGAPGPGSPPVPGKGPIVLTVENTRRELLKIAVPNLVGDGESGRAVAEVVSGDLSVSSWFKVIDPTSFLANLQAEGTGIVIGDWRNVGAQAVSKGRATAAGGELRLELKLYEMGRGDKPVLQKDYTGKPADLRRFAHAWSNEVVRYFTGEDGFFDTQIAFSAPSGFGRKDIYVMDYDGANVHRLTENGSQNILPAWSPSGGTIAFTSFLHGNPDLFTVSVSGGRPKVLSERPGVNMGAAYAPDGSRIACTLSLDGNSEIYVLGLDGKLQKRLTNQPAFIDSSPAWSPDGGTLAFVSNRQGSPQIFLMDGNGGNVRRLTMQGSYNQEPTWCPKCPVPTIAFTARDEKAHFDTFLIDVNTRQLTRLTENQGENEHPTWAPNGRALAVASSRGGIWVMTADGKQTRQVYKGAASTPTWGPAPRR